MLLAVCPERFSAWLIRIVFASIVLTRDKAYLSVLNSFVVLIDPDCTGSAGCGLGGALAVLRVGRVLTTILGRGGCFSLFRFRPIP